jgi:hypothetical protein
MKKYSTAKLKGAKLDLAVAMAAGHTNAAIRGDGVCMLGDPSRGEFFEPSTDWRQGGPIIDREQILLSPGGAANDWFAIARATWSHGSIDGGGPQLDGTTALQAAMRAYVASKLGETVELPASLGRASFT